MIGIESICTDSMSSPTLSALMIHEIDPTMKILLGYGGTKSLRKKIILFDKENSTHSPYLARQLSTEYHRQSSEGYPKKVD